MDSVVIDRMVNSMYTKILPIKVNNQVNFEIDINNLIHIKFYIIEV